MKHVLLIVLLGIRSVLFATEQSPDKLEYENVKLALHTGWGHPSPLQTYFYQNRMEYPFQMISTGNYRGHIASWKIKDGKFYLTQVEIREKIHAPEEYQIKSGNEGIGTENGVFADWFSGILECIQYAEGEEYYKQESIYFFQIRDGNVITIEKLKDWNEKRESGLAKMNENYITFYYRLDNDRIVLNGKDALLNTDVSRLSPIFDRYGKSFLDWPYNWENKEKSGAPNCKWLIEKDKLYLTELTLQYGLRFDTIYTDKISLQKEFKTKTSDRVFADWVSGVYLIQYGKLDIDEIGYEYFKTEECTLIRVAKGIVKESVTVSGEFNIKNPPDNAGEKLKKLIADYGNYSK